MKASITEISKITGMDRRAITLALADLESEKGNKGAVLYETQQAMPMLYTGSADSPRDLTKERARLTHHQANIAELDEDVRRGVLVDRDAVVIEVSEALANMRAKLLNIPHKVAPVIVAVEDLHEIKAVLESAVHEALTELYNQYVSDEPGSAGNEATAQAKG